MSSGQASRTLFCAPLLEEKFVGSNHSPTSNDCPDFDSICGKCRSNLSQCSTRILLLPIRKKKKKKKWSTCKWVVSIVAMNTYIKNPRLTYYHFLFFICVSYGLICYFPNYLPAQWTMLHTNIYMKKQMSGTYIHALTKVSGVNYTYSSWLDEMNKGLSYNSFFQIWELLYIKRNWWRNIYF